jgi:putative ABC transport system permease protein
VAQNEGTVLSRIKGLMLLITLAALFASALAVSAAMATAILNVAGGWTDESAGRRQSCRRGAVFAESTLLALMSGVAGFWPALAGASDRAIYLRFTDQH